MLFYPKMVFWMTNYRFPYERYKTNLLVEFLKHCLKTGWLTKAAAYQIWPETVHNQTTKCTVVEEAPDMKLLKNGLQKNI